MIEKLVYIYVVCAMVLGITLTIAGIWAIIKLVQWLTTK